MFPGLVLATVIVTGPALSQQFIQVNHLICLRYAVYFFVVDHFVNEKKTDSKKLRNLLKVKSQKCGQDKGGILS